MNMNEVLREIGTHAENYAIEASWACDQFKWQIDLSRPLNGLPLNSLHLAVSNCPYRIGEPDSQHSTVFEGDLPIPLLTALIEYIAGKSENPPKEDSTSHHVWVPIDNGQHFKVPKEVYLYIKQLEYKLWK